MDAIAPQTTDEWKVARRGNLGASRVADAIAKTKSGYAASRQNLMAELIVERITGTSQETFTSAAMQWGLDVEPDARAAYSFRTDNEVTETGFIMHPTIAMTGASPDGLIMDDGLIEIKCPNTATHIDTLLTNTIPGRYVTQMNWQMACTGRKWCDYVSYDPRMPASHSLFIKRVHLVPTVIASLEDDVREFLAELEKKLEALKQLKV